MDRDINKKKGCPVQKTIDRDNENERSHKSHGKKQYIRPKLVKADKLAQVTQGVEIS